MEDKVKQIIAHMFDVDVSMIHSNSGLAAGDITHWDSLGQLQLVLRIEKEIGIKFSMQDIQNMQDFSKILALVNSKVCL